MELYNYVKSAEKILNYMPGHMFIVDIHHKIAWANERAIRSYGFSSLNEIIGKKYSDFKCKINELACDIEAMDKSIFKSHKKINCMCYNKYSDGWKLTICEKSAILNKKAILIGLITYSSDVTDHNLIDIGRFIYDLEKNKLSHKQFSYLIEEEKNNCYSFSARQMECLFFLLRGKTDKDIAKIFNLSPRTIESYIQEIKYKMNCSTRTNIIEKSLNEGLFNIIPKSFLNQNMSSIH